MRIALVEDDPAQTELIAGWLVEAGHDCRHFGTGAGFLRAAQGEVFDLAILDWGLPDVTGIDVLATLRGTRRDPIAVLFVTVRDREADVVEALSSGADDYLSKPVSRGEMLARIEALGRRTGGRRVAAVLDAPPYRLDLDSGTLTRDGTPVSLTDKEFQLASYLFQNQGHLLSRGQILEQVWGTHPDLKTRTVDTHVSKLRAKLGLAPGAGWRLRSVYQHGYRLERLATAERGSA